MKKGEIPKKILLAIATGGQTGGFTLDAALNPELGGVLKSFSQWYRYQDKYSRYRIRKVFDRLRKQGIISMSKTADGRTRVLVTNQGKKLVAKYQMEEIRIKPPKKWDKKWRLLMVNIPESRKRARSEFYWKLKDMGFYHLQRCIWIYPYDCRKELEVIADFFDITSHIRLAEVSRFDGEKFLKHKYNL